MVVDIYGPYGVPARTFCGVSLRTLRAVSTKYLKRMYFSRNNSWRYPLDGLERSDEYCYCYFYDGFYEKSIGRPLCLEKCYPFRPPALRWEKLDKDELFNHVLS